MNVNQINNPNEAYDSVLNALATAAAGHSDYHKDATEQNTADALRSLADLYEQKTLPPLGTLASNTHGGLLEAYLRIFEEHSDFDGFKDRFGYDEAVTVVDGLITVDPLEPLDIEYSVNDNFYAANANTIALVAQAINEFNASGHTDAETYQGSSNFEAIDAQYDAYRFLDQAYCAIDESHNNFDC